MASSFETAAGPEHPARRSIQAENMIKYFVEKLQIFINFPSF
jgi:hypothetical protein